MALIDQKLLNSGSHDPLDLKLLRALALDGRETHFALSNSVGRSPSTIARRQRALEEAGIIAGYEARLDLRRLGYSTIVHVKMGLASQRMEVMAAFETAIEACPSIIRCDLMSGSDDYLVTIIARSLEHYADIHRDELSQLPGVVRMESVFVLREVIKSRLPPALFHKENRA